MGLYRATTSGSAIYSVSRTGTLLYSTAPVSDEARVVRPRGEADGTPRRAGSPFQLSASPRTAPGSPSMSTTPAAPTSPDLDRGRRAGGPDKAHVGPEKQRRRRLVSGRVSRSRFNPIGSIRPDISTRGRRSAAEGAADRYRQPDHPAGLVEGRPIHRLHGSGAGAGNRSMQISARPGAPPQRPISIIAPRSPNDYGSARISPDGRWIAYAWTNPVGARSTPCRSRTERAGFRSRAPAESNPSLEPRRAASFSYSDLSEAWS